MLGALLGWRATFRAVTALCLPAAIGILAGIPARAAGRPTGLRAELARLARPRLLLVAVALLIAGADRTVKFLSNI